MSVSFVPGDVILGATTIRQVVNSYVGTSPNVMVQYGSTGVTPQALFNDMVEPVANVTTEDLVTLLSVVSMSAGLGIASATAVTIPLRARLSLGTFSGSSVHATVSGSKGCLIVPETFSARQGQGQNVTATFSAHFLSDDGLSPLTFSASAAYASEAYTAAFGFGGATLTSSGPTVTTPDVVGWTVNTGISLLKQRSGSGLAPSEVYIERAEPSIDLTFRSVANLSTLTATIKALTAVQVFGRRRTDMGTYVADDQSSHLSFSFGDALGATQQVGGSGRSAAEVTYRIMGKTLTASTATALA